MNQAVSASQCELCERIVVQLTRHHLVPRSRVKKRKRRGHLPRRLESKLQKSIRFGRRKAVGDFENPLFAPNALTEQAPEPEIETPQLLDPDTTINLCRACHSTIHAILTHKELETEYCTLQTLRAQPDIARFILWVSRQSDRRVSIRRPNLYRKQRRQMKRHRNIS